MAYLDLPVIVLRFPKDIEEQEDAILLNIDATGDVLLKLPDRVEASRKAAEAFTLFWSGSEQQKLLKFLKRLFDCWKDPVHLFTAWHDLKEQFIQNFNGEILDFESAGLNDVLLALKGGFVPAQIMASQKRSLKDIAILEVKTEARNAPYPYIVTQIDWKGDFHHVLSPTTIPGKHVYRCHREAVQLSLFIKSTIQEFLVKLIRMIVFPI